MKLREQISVLQNDAAFFSQLVDALGTFSKIGGAIHSKHAWHVGYCLCLRTSAAKAKLKGFHENRLRPGEFGIHFRCCVSDQTVVFEDSQRLFVTRT